MDSANMRLYPYLLAVFAALLLISNISAVKLIEFGPIVADGGAFLFPLVYVIGDILAEVYGFKATRRAILTGFSVSVLAALTFWVVQIAPYPSEWMNQDAFSSVLGFVPRIVLASVLGFLAGQLLNAYVLVRIKARYGEGQLWARLIGSTVVGEFADTLIFCTIAFYGVISGTEFLSYVLFGYVYKTLIEVFLLPITYPVIGFVKRYEASTHNEIRSLP
jgi:uncharacterized integral membrane protein (TIGR00697 family)